MLTLPGNWQKIMSGAVAVQLIGQGTNDAARTEIAQHLISATLDQMVTGWTRRGGNRRQIQVLPDLRWRLRNLIYHYFPVVDDEVLESCANADLCLFDQILIVPPNCEWILRQALKVTQPQMEFSVSPVDGFITLHTGFASVDLEWDREQTVKDLLKRYNRCVRKAGADESLLVDIELQRESKEEPLQELRLTVPTYNARLFPNQVSAGEKPEFGRPDIPVLIREAAGVRIVLGTHDYEDYNKPDIQIERQPNAWAIFLHPLGGGDPCGLLYFLDDGRSFLIRELDLTGTPMVQVLEHDESIPEVHGKDD